MELVRKPILRVPLVLALTGLVCRCPNLSDRICLGADSDRPGA